MRTLLYRLTALRVRPKGAGCVYEAHLTCEGKQKAFRGTCEVVADLKGAIDAQIRQVYHELTGKDLPAEQ